MPTSMPSLRQACDWEGGVKNPERQVLDQARMFGQGDEAVRLNQPAGRMLPANKCRILTFRSLPLELA